MSDDSLSPEEFAEAAGAAILDAQSRPEETRDVLAEAGLFSVSVAEDHGGMGLGIEFSVPVAQTAGEKQLRFPVVEQIVLARAFAGTEAGEALLGGALTGTIAFAGSLEAGFAARAAFATTADVMLVADGDGAALIDLGSVTVEADATLDPEAPSGFARLEGAKVLARLDAAAYAGLKRDVTILFAAFVNGAAEGALNRSADYLAQRVQFGRPLSAKQAVRHHLARMKLGTEVAIARLRRALLDNEFAESRAVETALTGALSNAVFVVEKAIHLHGGMGFTEELPLHYSLRDVRKIETALQAGAQTRAIGRAFIDAA
ncbi:acyl-CoA dehydrogenase family protein [Falsigemmobacter intermedius]|uniref:Acyl-CoA dehydrogenase n=1 Tax=Falsigemmobacter intermedius TaxID=1553448 RepID=A0A3S3YPK1_9RHOB|nr:acyl-CoA dehydrogenase family protein [Falsigemmobacter intermedius]RWY43617.1 acyl-CoA dehydrogenase [Falsigemmobacter intermedius]